MIYLNLLIEHQNLLLFHRLKVYHFLKLIDNFYVSRENNRCGKIISSIFDPFFLRIWSLFRKSSEYRLIIHKKLKFIHSSFWSLAVIVDFNSTYGDWLIESYGYEIWFSLIWILLLRIGSGMRSSKFEWSQPHVFVIKCKIIVVE